MQCPRCKSHSVHIRQGAKVCGVRECLYVDVHPISFENDVLHYEGQDHRENRFSTAFANHLSNGGIAIEKEANFDKNYRLGKKVIADMCHILKLSDIISKVAQSRFLYILKMRNERKVEGLMEEDEGEEKKKKEQIHERSISITNIAAYSLYSACFEKGNYFMNYNIMKQLNMTMKAWTDIVYKLNSALKGKIDFVPEMKAIHLIKRVCRKRKIAHAQERAMEEMLETLNKVGQLSSLKINTVAALVFWKICSYSEKYSKVLNLQQICKKHEKLEEEGVPVSQIQKYFDITSDNVRKVFKDSVQKNFHKMYLPNWNGRKDCKISMRSDDQDQY